MKVRTAVLKKSVISVLFSQRFGRVIDAVFMVSRRYLLGVSLG